MTKPENSATDGQKVSMLPAWIVRHNEFVDRVRAESDAITSSLNPNAINALTEQVRRQLVQEERDDIDGDPLPFPEVMTLTAMLQRLVFIQEGSRVALRGSPQTVLPFEDFKRASRASMARLGNRNVACADLWLEHEERFTVHTLTFRAGASEFTTDPNGVSALNIWSPRQRDSFLDPASLLSVVTPFIEHARYLVPVEAECERFLNWLAHLEQRPGELPHTHYLMVTPQTGIGRNWMASCLARVWPGETLLGFDLAGTLKSGFNGLLSARTLVVVDELQAAANGFGAPEAQTLKAMLTAEVRMLNPKFGRHRVEHNAARFLMFSQHHDALPLEQYDRRVIVIENPTERRSQDYYRGLYALLDDSEFIKAVAQYLGERDISGFNPSEPAALNEAKARAIQASTSDLDRSLVALREGTSVELMRAQDIAEFLRDQGIPIPGGRAMGKAYKAAGFVPCKRMPCIFKKQVRVVALRNPARWVNAPAEELAAELRDQVGE